MPGLPPYAVTVIPPASPGPDGYAFSLESPLASGVVSAISIQLRGFVIRTDGQARRPIRISLRVGGRELWGGMIDRPRPDVIEAPKYAGRIDVADILCGFDLVLPAFLSATDSPVDVFVVLEAEEASRLADFHLVSIGFRSLLGPARRDPVGVLSINSLGRSGSSLLCRILGAHPAFCVPTLEGQYGEVFVLGQYARAIAVLGSEGSITQVNKILAEPDFMTFPVGYMAMDDRGAGREAGFQQDLAGLGVRHGRALFYDAADRVADYVRATKPGASYWVEKTWNSKCGNIAAAMLERWREIILVRNPKAFWRSQYLYQHKILEADDEMRGHISGTFDKLFHLRNSIADKAATALVVRYEDLVREPAAVFARILDYLGLAPDPAFLATVGDLALGEDQLRLRQDTSGMAEPEAVAFEQFLGQLSALDRVELERIFADLGYPME